MKNFFNGIVKASLEQWAGFAVVSFLLSLVVLAIIAISVDHEIECYYLYAYQDNGFVVHKIYAFANWQLDEITFASMDANEALAVLGQLKQCAAK